MICSRSSHIFLVEVTNNILVEVMCSRSPHIILVEMICSTICSLLLWGEHDNVWANTFILVTLFHSLNMKYLKLNIPSLKCLPSPLCTLSNLQTLDMPSSYVDQTPEDIWKMQKLMHLNFGSITLPAPPKNYSSSLKNLIFISALHPSSCTPDILCRLPNLQTLRVSGDLSCYHSGVSKSVCKLHKVECLKLVNESKLSRMVLSEYQFPPSLMQLSLSNTELMEDPMPMLEKLPRLQVLKLK